MYESKLLIIIRIVHNFFKDTVVYYCVKYRGSLLDCSWQWHHHSVITLVWRQKTDDPSLLPCSWLFSSHLHMHRYEHMISMVRIQTNSTPWSTIFHVLHYSPALQATLSSLVLGWCSDHLHHRGRNHINHRGCNHNDHPDRDRFVIS